jgi:hypothetical protein
VSQVAASLLIVGTVLNGTALVRSRCHHGCMDNKRTKELNEATRASVVKEMAKPRMSRSAKIIEMHLDPNRIPERPSTTMPGTVDKTIASPDARRPEKAQIAVDGADQHHRLLRIENSLTDEHGDDVRLKKGTHVEVTVTSEPAAAHKFT